MTAILPSRSFFLYLNIDVFPAACAAYRGVLITSSTYGSKMFRHLSYWPLHLLKGRRLLRFQKELHLEQVRLRFFPKQVSRLHGIYLWGDEESARRGERWREAEGNQFHRDYLVEVGFTYRRISKVDTNWIDKYLLPDSVPLDGNNLGWMHSYWKGEPCPDMEPLWEYIAEGRGLIYGTALRMRAFDKIKDYAPRFIGQLELGRVAVELGSDLYHLAPFILRVSQGLFRVDYYLDRRDENDSFMEKIGDHINLVVAQRGRSQINFEALSLLHGQTHMPDLRPMGFGCDCSALSVDEQTLWQLVVSSHDGSTWHGLTAPSGAKTP